MIGPPSLLRHLLAWSLGALVLVWACFVAAGFATGLHEGKELTDGHLASTAVLVLESQNIDFNASQRAAEIASAVPELSQHDYQESLSVVVWDHGGRLLTRNGEAPEPRFDMGQGFADLRLGSPPALWRTYARWDGPAHGRKVMVLLSAAERDELAWDIAAQTAVPGLLLLPVVALLLALAVRRGLQPWFDLSNDVRALDVRDAEPMRVSRRHRELVDVVDAINLLAQRQRQALDRERQLASIFAHELRTPLASLALAARSLQGPLDAAERQAHLVRLEEDALRAGQVVQQLLALARAGPGDLIDKGKPVELLELAKRVLGGYADAAIRSGHDLGLDGCEPLSIDGHPLLLELALRNLIENALTHTPAGTRIAVQVDAGQRRLQVCDDGPGDALPHRAFGTTAGLGLGHRVVRQVAQAHGGHFGEVEAPNGYTRCYRIAFGPPAGSRQGGSPAATFMPP